MPYGQRVLSFVFFYKQKFPTEIPEEIRESLLTDQFGNFKGHIGKNNPWIAVHLNMIVSRFKHLGQFNDVSLVDKRGKAF